MSFYFLFFFTATATTEIYTLSLHDALPICLREGAFDACFGRKATKKQLPGLERIFISGPPAVVLPLEVGDRSEEHTSELQSHHDLVCRLLLEKKKKHKILSTILKRVLLIMI